MPVIDCRTIFIVWNFTWEKPGWLLEGKDAVITTCVRHRCCACSIRLSLVFQAELTEWHSQSLYLSEPQSLTMRKLDQRDSRLFQTLKFYTTWKLWPPFLYFTTPFCIKNFQNTRTWKIEKPSANVSENYNLRQRSVGTEQSQHAKLSCSDGIFFSPMMQYVIVKR